MRGKGGIGGIGGNIAGIGGNIAGIEWVQEGA